jgi:hypothetical protein
VELLDIAGDSGDGAGRVAYLRLWRGRRGVASFNVPQIAQQPFPQASSTSTTHGIFDFGGGVDMRLNRQISIRGEVRDYVTGEGLGGISGRNHRVVSGGLAFHF